MMDNRSVSMFLLVVLTLFFLSTLSCCTQSAMRPTPTPSTEVSPTLPENGTPTPLFPTSTPEPSPSASQQLVICMTEPVAASPFMPSRSGDDLLALFYEPPLERRNYRWEARLVERVPSVTTGDVITRQVTVAPGARYADASGAILVHEGESALALPQLVVTFTLKSDLRWSDSHSLTSDDILLGYHLAQSKTAQGSWQELLEYTAQFVALDQYTLLWEGLPGYLTADYARFLFPPQPAHRWQGQQLEQILQDLTPPATGPFQIISWEKSREVRLRRNPHYVGTPSLLEEIVVRFPQQAPEMWPDLLVSGQCDIVTSDPAMTIDRSSWTTPQASGTAMIWTDAAFVILRLDFNLAPKDEQPSPLSDLRVRRGLAQCLNLNHLRQSATNNDEILLPADGFLPPGYPTSPSGVSDIADADIADADIADADIADADIADADIA
ncbi:MAG: hypothetical protein JXA33_06525, partial [Anaerolineae bacterium]|nr:hypothetical protein [Anaerolineae bacterium]